MKTSRYVYGITLDELLLKYADRTVQHKPLSAMEGQRVALMTLGTLTEIRGDSLNSGHRWPENWKLSRVWVGYFEETKMPMGAI